jgi:hypothetical protein
MFVQLILKSKKNNKTIFYIHLSYSKIAGRWPHCKK